MKRALSLADLEQYDPHAPHRKRERRFLCPECGDGKPRDRAHRSLCVDTHTGAWICHRCQAKGLLKDFWTDKPKQTRRERTRVALTRAFALPPQDGEVGKRDEDTVKDWIVMWGASQPLEGTPGTAYLEGRGIPEDVAHEAGVRYSAQWYGRPAVLFPMYDKAGSLVALNGRFIDGRTDPKTQTAGSKSLGLFATPGALSAPVIAVCEGPVDALALWLCGVASVALVGVSWPEWLPLKLAFQPVLIATDADQSGDAAAVKLTADLKSRAARPFRLRPRGVNDWGEMLERRGVEFLRPHLAPFSEAADDELRAEAAWGLMCDGREEVAHFVASLIEDGFAREVVRARMQRAQETSLVAAQQADENDRWLHFDYAISK